MKGIVFNILNEMVEEKFGFEAWEGLLEATGLDGIFVATETFPDEDLFKLVAAAETATGIPAETLVRSFGEYMVPQFARHYPVFFENQSNLKHFLLTVDEVIHVEVRKLFPDAGLPKFDYVDREDNQLTMLYRSPRKLCVLAEGLITGSAAHFGQQIDLSHDVCMHQGSDHCELVITMAS